MAISGSSSMMRSPGSGHSQTIFSRLAGPPATATTPLTADRAPLRPAGAGLEHLAGQRGVGAELPRRGGHHPLHDAVQRSAPIRPCRLAR